MNKSISCGILKASEYGPGPAGGRPSGRGLRPSQPCLLAPADQPAPGGSDSLGANPWSSPDQRCLSAGSGRGPWRPAESGQAPEALGGYQITPWGLSSDCRPASIAHPPDGGLVLCPGTAFCRTFSSAVLESHGHHRSPGPEALQHRQAAPPASGRNPRHLPCCFRALSRQAAGS